MNTPNMKSHQKPSALQATPHTPFINFSPSCHLAGGIEAFRPSQLDCVTASSPKPSDSLTPDDPRDNNCTHIMDWTGLDCYHPLSHKQYHISLVVYLHTHTHNFCTFAHSTVCHVCCSPLLCLASC